MDTMIACLKNRTDDPHSLALATTLVALNELEWAVLGFDLAAQSDAAREVLIDQQQWAHEVRTILIASPLTEFTTEHVDVLGSIELQARGVLAILSRTDDAA